VDSATYHGDNVGPCWRDGITQLLQIGQRHIHVANSPFHLIPKILCWVWSATMFRYTVVLSWYQGT
jgi:hypothetical protein